MESWVIQSKLFMIVKDIQKCYFILLKYMLFYRIFYLFIRALEWMLGDLVNLDIFGEKVVA